MIGKQGILSDGEHFHRVYAETLQVVQFLHGAGECVGECTYVQFVNHHGIEGGLGKSRHIEIRVNDYGLGLIVVAGQAKAVGQVESGELLGPGIVEFARDGADLNYVPILVACLGAGHRARPSGIRGIGMTRLLGQRHRRSAVDLDGDIVDERSPYAKCSGSVLMQSRAERVGCVGERRLKKED